MPLSHCDTWIVDRKWAYSVQRVPDCLGGLSRVGISSRSTRPWNGQPPSSYYLPRHGVASGFDCVNLIQQTTVSSLAPINHFILSFSEPKCARGRHILFLESIFQHSLYKIVQLSVNHNSYNKKSIRFRKAK